MFPFAELMRTVAEQVWGKYEFGFGFGLVNFEMPKHSHECR